MSYNYNPYANALFGSYGGYYSQSNNMYPQTQSNAQMANLPPQMQQQPQGNNAIPQYNSYIAYVNGYAGAQGFVIEPNSQRFLMDSDSNHFYIKTSDANGRCSIQIFEYSEVGQSSPVNKVQQVDMSKYATVDMIDELRSELEAIKPKRRKQEEKEDA